MRSNSRRRKRSGSCRKSRPRRCSRSRSRRRSKPIQFSPSSAVINFIPISAVKQNEPIQFIPISAVRKQASPITFTGHQPVFTVSKTPPLKFIPISAVKHQSSPRAFTGHRPVSVVSAVSRPPERVHAADLVVAVGTPKTKDTVPEEWFTEADQIYGNYLQALKDEFRRYSPDETIDFIFLVCFHFKYYDLKNNLYGNSDMVTKKNVLDILKIAYTETLQYFLDYVSNPNLRAVDCEEQIVLDVIKYARELQARNDPVFKRRYDEYERDWPNKPTSFTQHLLFQKYDILKTDSDCLFYNYNNHLKYKHL